MMNKSGKAWGLTAVLLAGLAALGANAADVNESSGSVKEFHVIQQAGGRLDWSQARNRLVFDKEGPDGFYDIHVMTLRGQAHDCLTCDKPGLPGRHNGQPAWHPSGEYIVFQSQNEDAAAGRGWRARFENAASSPGAGRNNSLWLMTGDGSRFWELVHTEKGQGILHPHFSHDGKKLVWTEMVKSGFIGWWVIKLADFSVQDGTPALSNIQTMRPASGQFYEAHGFSPDDSSIIFSVSTPGQGYYGLEIYTLDLQTRQLTQITQNDEWDEHAQFSTDGRYIVWGSSEGIPQEKGRSRPLLDYWVADADGSNKRRLTRFNDPEAPEYLKGGYATADFAWGPSIRGRQYMLAYLIQRQKSPRNPILLIGADFESPSAR